MSKDGEKTDAQLRWIYEGTKSLVNREDYLLGKKLDKNFELYSDAVVEEKEGGIEAVVKQRAISGPSSSKVSNLEVDVVRTEDPLVAIKLKQENIRREKIENPLVILKMKKLLKKAMEKKERKRLKKEEKHRKRHKHSSRSSSEHSDKKRHEKEKGQSDHLEATTSKEKHKSEESRSHKEQRRKQTLQRDSHIPEHLRPKYSSDESERDEASDDRTSANQQKFGMITKSGSERSKASSVAGIVNPYESLPRKSAASKPSYKRPEKRKKLTAEEVEAKRREMMDNAEWRDQVRNDNIKKSVHRDQAEERGNTGKTAAFIRPILNSAVSSSTMERQINSHRRELQKPTAFTEQKFMRK